MNGLNYRFSSKALVASIIAIIVLALCQSGFADPVNAFMVIPAEDSIVYDFGDHVTLKITLTNAENDTIHADEWEQNGMTLLQLWVSGPKQDYYGVEGYAPLIIMNTADGFNPNVGFDPETGLIDVSVDDNEAGTGSYTALVKVTRRVGNTNYSRYAKADFLVGQRLATRAAFNSWNNCRSCHSPSRHATSDLSNCIVCHAKDHARPMQAIIHDIGEHPQSVGRCTNCHKAGAGLTNFRRTACFSCHNAPGNHANYVDDQCAGCHTGNNSPYARHNIAVPTQPSAFNLTSPADGDTILPEDSLIFINFNWQASHDNDALDFITYRFEIAENEDFDDARVLDSLTETSFEMVNLPLFQRFWWRVRAEDLNSAGRWSNGAFNFVTHVEEPPPPPPPENHPPSAFGLVSPEDDALIEVDPLPFRTQVLFSWERSTDPDSGAFVQYLIKARLIDLDSVWVNQVVDDTFLLADFWYPILDHGLHRTVWSVRAISQGDTIGCDSAFVFNFLWPNSVQREYVHPDGYGLLTAYPNPFNSTVSIRYAGGLESAATRLGIYDTQGRPVADLLGSTAVSGGRSFHPAAEGGATNGGATNGGATASGVGKHSVVWNADGVAAGIYFVRLEAGGEVRTKKIVLVR